MAEWKSYLGGQKFALEDESIDKEEHENGIVIPRAARELLRHEGGEPLHMQGALLGLQLSKLHLDQLGKERRIE